MEIGFFKVIKNNIHTFKLELLFINIDDLTFTLQFTLITKLVLIRIILITNSIFLTFY